MTVDHDCTISDVSEKPSDSPPPQDATEPASPPSSSTKTDKSSSTTQIQLVHNSNVVRPALDVFIVPVHAVTLHVVVEGVVSDVVRMPTAIMPG